MCYGVGVYSDLQMDNVHQRTTAMLEMCICLLAEEAPEQSQGWPKIIFTIHFNR